jgi:abequosyltransferase
MSEVTSAIKLSICIATYKRGQFISRSLDSIIRQIQPGVEIVVVDGASPDNTETVMKKYVAKCSQITYFREEKNSGVDRDFDKAVSYAKGDYCWLMTDDDLLCDGAIEKILTVIKENRDLIIVNATVKNSDLTEVLEERRLKINSDIKYDEGEQEQLFSDTASYMSFIGCVVMKRSHWDSRDKASYFGTLFIHIGVIFQSPLLKTAIVLCEPLIIIRYGNAMWTSRGFEIWMNKWPKLIWSFTEFSDSSKQKVCRLEPWRSAKTLFFYRAMGAFSLSEIEKIQHKNIGILERIITYGVSRFPAKLANFMLVFYFSFRPNNSWRHMYDLLHSPKATKMGKLLARKMKVKAVN